jgi:hypothetical protein
MFPHETQPAKRWIPRPPHTHVALDDGIEQG